MQQHVGLQIADALTNCVRRALIGNIQTDGWRHVRKLMINHREGSVKFITMGPRHGSIRGQPYAVVAKLLTRGERGMLTERAPQRAPGP